MGGRHEMKVIEISRFGGPEVLTLAQRPIPEPGEGEVLIAVAAAGVSKPDALQRRGLYPPPKGASDVPGLEIAGTITALGPRVSGLAAGDRVCALVSGGGYAEHCVAPREQVLPLPSGLSFAEAAALPENMFTVWTNVFERGRLSQGETLLVHGGASGIGTTAIACARAFGARVIATARGRAKCDACARIGASRAIDYSREDFVEAVKSETHGLGADVILDMVAGDYVQRDIDALAIEGRIVLIAYQRAPVASFNVMSLMQKRGTITGSTLRARPPAEKGAIAAQLSSKVWPLLVAGEIQPVIDSQFALEEASKAHERLDRGAHIGKIVLNVTSYR
jgi:putative PIG3 family NAD(P)H quinone oxidoreductase